MFLKPLNAKHNPNGQDNLTDEELLAAFMRERDADTLGELFKRYVHLIYGVCLKYLNDEEDAKDAVMQVFEKLLEIREGSEILNFKPWIHAVAKNHCLMYLRHIKAEDRMLNVKYLELKDEIMEMQGFAHLDEKDRHEAKIRKLKEAIQFLSDDQKICIELFFLKELSYNEISECTGLGLSKVKSSIQNGKRNLQLIMNDGANRR